MENTFEESLNSERSPNLSYPKLLDCGLVRNGDFPSFSNHQINEILIDPALDGLGLEKPKSTTSETRQKRTHLNGLSLPLKTALHYLRQTNLFQGTQFLSLNNPPCLKLITISTRTRTISQRSTRASIPSSATWKYLYLQYAV